MSHHHINIQHYHRITVNNIIMYLTNNDVVEYILTCRHIFMQFEYVRKRELSSYMKEQKEIRMIYLAAIKILKKKNTIEGPKLNTIEGLI